MASKLKVIGLISGGKDSIFSLFHCLANGHELVALANLHPAPGSDHNTPDDIDSYMYQTIGHNVTPLYADALGLPLYRQPISGTAVHQAQSYRPAAAGTGDLHDETEDLVPLLLRIRAAHPDATALCSGAILSTYQRTRVESIALRLGLVPLAFLWQYPTLPPHRPAALLDDMYAVGVDARIVKVASGSLDERHLWLNVADPATVARLGRDMGRFGELGEGDVLGEGGEFETLALDGPWPLWKKRIEVAEDERRVVGGPGGAAAVSILRARVVDKKALADGVAAATPRIPALLDGEFENLLHALTNAQAPAPVQHSNSGARSTQSTSYVRNKAANDSKGNDTVWFSNITAAPDRHGSAIESQLQSILTQLRARLDELSLSTASIACTTILLRRMSDFAAVNTVYGTLFTQPDPAARITVATGDALAAGVDVMVHAAVSRGELSRRRGLHVQSRSYWAPANIGPYSQAVAVPVSELEEDEGEAVSRVMFVAGQIPLVPASMGLCGGSFAEQAVLALQHLWRVGRVMRVQWWLGGAAFITASSGVEAAERAATALAAWRGVHERAGAGEDDEAEFDDDFDVGDAQLHRGYGERLQGKGQGHRRELPDLEVVDCEGQGPTVPPCLVAEVAELPRGAPIEWVSQGLHVGSGVDGRRAKVTTEAEGGARRMTDGASGISWTYTSIRLDEANDYDGEQGLFAFQEGDLTEAYVAQGAPQWLHDRLRHDGSQVIGCRRVWDEHGEVACVLRQTTRLAAFDS